MVEEYIGVAVQVRVRVRELVYIAVDQEQEQELGKVAALAQDKVEEQVQVRTMKRNKEK